MTQSGKKVARFPGLAAGFLGRALVCSALLLALPAGAKEPGASAGAHARSAKEAGSKKAAGGAKKKPKGAKKGSSGGSAAAAPRAAAAPSVAPLALDLAVQKAEIESGLRVVMNVDRSSPTIAVAVTYEVGARDEEKGQSGFARLIERMMFQGSANVAPGEHARLVASHGGVADSMTSADRTAYVDVLPSNELALALWLEADRMRSLDVGAGALERARDSVEKEGRARVSDAAYGPSAVRLEELVYQGYFPYEHAGAGPTDDLARADLVAVAAFHARRYAPNNAVVSIAGDFDTDEAMGLVRRYFASIPRAEVAPFEAAPLGEQTSQRTAVLHDAHAGAPDVLYGWAIPPARSAEHAALEVAASILADGRSSRLADLLVRDKAVARRVEATTPGRRGPDLFRIDVELASGASPRATEKLVEGVIKDLATRGPTDAELARAQRRLQVAAIAFLQTNASRALRLGELEASSGDARLLGGEVARVLAVTAADVKRAAAEHLGPTRRTIVETYPPGDEPAPAPRAHEARHEEPAGGEPSSARKAPGAKKGPSARKAEGAKKKPATKAKKQKKP